MSPYRINAKPGECGSRPTRTQLVKRWVRRGRRSFLGGALGGAAQAVFALQNWPQHAELVAGLFAAMVAMFAFDAVWARYIRHRRVSGHFTIRTKFIRVCTVLDCTVCGVRRKVRGIRTGRYFGDR